jgi:hypothetical protein
MIISILKKMKKVFTHPPQEQIPAPEGRPVVNPIPPDEQPIDDNVWFKLSRSWVNNADDRIQKQSENVQNTIKWFFGLGSSATIIGIFLKDPKMIQLNGWLFFFVVLFLMIAYALSTLATTTISKSVDTPNDAEKIREVFNKSNKEAKFYLVISSICLFLGMALIAPALMSSFKTTAVNDSLSFTGSYESRIVAKEQFLKSIHVSGYCAVAKSIIIRVDTGGTIGTAANIIYFTQPLNRPEFNIAYPMVRDTLIKLSKINVYLTVGYKDPKDTLFSKCIKLNQAIN